MKNFKSLSRSLLTPLFLSPVLGFGGCSFLPSVGPEYSPPETSVRSEYVGLGTEKSGGPSSQTPVRAAWWMALQDDVLPNLISRAVEKNYDLAIASSRLRESRALRQQSIGGFLPTISSLGSLNRGERSLGTATGSFVSGERTTTSYTTGFDSSWEIDIFGGTRREVEAATGEVGAAEASLDNVMTSLAAEVAGTYVELRALQKRHRIAVKNVTVQTESVDLVKARFDAGLTSELDLRQAEAERDSTAAQVPLLLENIRLTSLRVGVLLGEDPSTIAMELEKGPAKDSSFTIPSPPQEFGVGVPSELLRERPDIRQAERSLAAATARIGVAVADLFPKFNLGTSLGVEAMKGNDLFSLRSRYWSFVPGVRLPLFQGGRVLADISVQRERTAQALANYEQAVLRALAEVEGALFALQREGERYVALNSAFKNTERSLELSKELYVKGLADFQRVIDAERSAFTAEDLLVQSEQSRTTQFIAIQKALGAGWQPLTPASTPLESEGSRTVVQVPVAREQLSDPSAAYVGATHRVQELWND